MDGVLINSEVKYQDLFMQFFKDRGVFIEKEELLFLVGSSRRTEDEFIASRLDISVERAQDLKKTFFEYIVSKENFKRAKPNPEIYEYISKQFGISKDEIWVVEDSEHGIEAAKKAGLKVMGLYNKELYQDLTGANLIMSSLKQIMEEDIW